MPRCGCARDVCSCAVINSSSVKWSGSGIQSDPYTAAPADLLKTQDTATLALDLEISGSTATLSAQPLIVGDVQVFTADGTWTKPAGVTFARVLMVGGGGGGASGQAVWSGGLGGGGGDAGQVAIFTLVGADIPASAAVVIGQGGAGGASVTSGDGLSGAAGSDTQFAARRVRGGAGGRPLGQAPVHLAQGTPPGQFAVDSSQEFVAAHPYLGPGAGGAGEGQSRSPQPGGYSLPGQGSRYPDNTGGGATGGGHGRNELVTKMGGGGGGGTNGTAGGNGGLYGGGGGGGGYEGFTGHPSGKGGKGANGILVVISW